MTSGSLIPTMCLISSRADLTLKSQCVMSSAAGRRDQHPVQCVVFDVRDPQFSRAIRPLPLAWWTATALFLTRRLPKDPARNVLLSGARLLISDFKWRSLRRDPHSAVLTLFSVYTVSLHRDIATNVILADCSSDVARAGVLVGARGGAG